MPLKFVVFSSSLERQHKTELMICGHKVPLAHQGVGASKNEFG